MKNRVKKVLYNILTDAGLGFGFFVIGGLNTITFVTDRLGWFMLIPASIAIGGLAMMYAGYRKYKNS